MCDMCIYVCRTCSSGPANVAYVCECVHHLIHVVRSLRHFKLRSWVRVRFRLFALVAGKTNPQLERAVVVPHWKVVHLERLTAGVTGVGDTGAGKFWVISDLWMCGGYLFQTVRGKKPAASHQMDVQLLSCACRDCNSDISLTPRHLNALTLNPDSHHAHFCYDV